MNLASADLIALLATSNPVVASGQVFNLSTDVTVTNKTLIINGLVMGPGRLILSGASTIIGCGTISGGGVFIQDSGSYVISGLKFAGISATAAILVEPTAEAVITSLIILRNEISNGNYGILRSGGLGQINATRIAFNKIHDMQGDAIELNVVVNDANISIANNDIWNVVNTNGLLYWGIGIGVSGLAYDNLFTDANYAKGFTIEGNNISSCRQPIHVEAAKNFSILNNIIDDTSSEYSPASQLAPVGIVTYGCTGFSISGNTVNRQEAGKGILISPGVVDAVFVALPSDFVVSNNTMTGLASLWGTEWATTGSVSITDNVGYGETISGGPAGMVQSGNNWTSP